MNPAYLVGTWVIILAGSVVASSPWINTELSLMDAEGRAVTTRLSRWIRVIVEGIVCQLVYILKPLPMVLEIY